MVPSRGVIASPSLMFAGFIRALCAVLLLASSSGQVVINEIHYHPVELPAFQTDGTPQLDLAEDLHEFIELHNPGAAPVDLSGWKLVNAVDFTFSPGTVIGPGSYLVVARNRSRVETVYGISGVLGNYDGQLSNSDDAVRLRNAAGETVDAVSYSSQFPWPTSADGLGADDDFTLLNSASYQYKGRSLERVSAAAPANDPANWLASPLGASPTPGSPNAVVQSVPKPVVISLRVTQGAADSLVIRSGQPVKVTGRFSNGPLAGPPQVEYFLDDRNSFVEPRLTVITSDLGGGEWQAILPAQSDRTLVRFRVLADRGGGLEPVSPRADDAAIVPVSATTREAWHSYFVAPNRTSLNPIYDIFVSDADLAQLNTNISQSPKRVTSSAITGLPRATPYVAATAPLWNGTKPAVFVHNGVVREIQLRYHGSRYNRRASRNSWKVQFPGTQKLNDIGSFFITDKSDYFTVGQGIFIAGNLPVSECRWVEWYLNSNARLNRLQQGEYDNDMLDQYHLRMQSLTPGTLLEPNGEIYKSVGTIEAGGEGPYGRGDERLLPAGGPWTALQRYDWTYSTQNHGWKGPAPIRDLLTGLWAARGDTFSAPNPNIPQLATWLNQTFDVPTALNSLAILNWMCPWDDTTQNHMLWRRSNGRWATLPWDFDGFFGNGDSTGAGSSIYLGEVGLPSSFPGNNSRGPNFVKDSLFKAFREEYKNRFWLLNNTLLHPENLKTLFYQDVGGNKRSYYAFINGVKAGFCEQRYASVNTQTGHLADGSDFLRPAKPVNQSPAANAPVLPPALLVASPYVHSSGNPTGINAHARSKWQIRTGTGSFQQPLVEVNSTTDLTTLPIPFGALAVGATYFWRVIYYDGADHPSIASAETAFVFGATSPGSVTINEVLTDNRSVLINGGARPDYIELFNNSATAVDLSGWGLTDDLQSPVKFVFPPGTAIAAQGYLTVWCDLDLAAPGLHTGFSLSSEGEALALTQGNAVRDYVQFGPQAANLPIGRVPNGTGPFTLIAPSPGAANVAQLLGSATALKINEWMANPASGEDWLEIYNPDPNPVALSGLYLSDTPSDPTITRLPALSFIAGQGYTVFVADGTSAGGNRVNFKLGAGGDTLVLTQTNAATAINSISFDTQDLNVSAGHLPDGSTSDFVSFPQSATPGASNYRPAPIVISEALSRAEPPFEDAVEFFNPNDTPMNIGGWWLSNDGTNLQKHQLPAGTTVPARGFGVVYENQFNQAPGQANSFSLSPVGGPLYLSATDTQGNLTGDRAQVRLGGVGQHISHGRITVVGGTEFWPLIAHTFGRDNPGSVTEFRLGTGGANAGPKIGPIIINEIMYHPADLPGGGDNVVHEFVELHNITTSLVNVGGWKLTGESGFIFPAGTMILPGDYVLLVSFDPADAPALTAFRTRYGLGSATMILGPHTPKLSNAFQRLELVVPDTSVAGETPLLLVDRVEYRDATPWPATADGTGQTLQRGSRTIIGNDPGNWSSAAPTPGGVNAGQTAIGDSDGDGMTDTFELAYGLNRFDATDANQDADDDGRTNLHEAVAGTDPRNAASFFEATVTRVDGGFQIQWTAQANTSYSLLYRDSLTEGVWTKLGDHSAQPNAHPASITDLTSVPIRFYRVVTPQQ